jgi:type I restriction enzyme R subunit
LSDPKRISNIVKYIIEQFNRKTKRNSRLYELNKIKNISEVVETKDQTKIKEIKEKVKLS